MLFYNINITFRIGGFGLNFLEILIIIFRYENIHISNSKEIDW